jgi:hypothetical protein
VGLLLKLHSIDKMKQPFAIVFVLAAASRPEDARLGTADGANTALLADALHEGQEVVTGETAASAQTAVKNPFLPKVIRR